MLPPLVSAQAPANSASNDPMKTREEGLKDMRSCPCRHNNIGSAPITSRHPKSKPRAGSQPQGPSTDQPTKLSRLTELSCVKWRLDLSLSTTRMAFEFQFTSGTAMDGASMHI